MRARDLLLLSWLRLAISTATAAAQDASGSDSSSDSADVSVMSLSGSNSSNTTTSTDSGVEWFLNNMAQGETRLVGGLNANVYQDEIWQELCDSLPSVQTYNTSMTPNGGCPDEFTVNGASCTCLTDYNSSSSTAWSFRVTAKTTQATYPLTESATDALQVDTIETVYLPTTVTSL